MPGGQLLDKTGEEWRTVWVGLYSSTDHSGPMNRLFGLEALELLLRGWRSGGSGDSDGGSSSPPTSSSVAPAPDSIKAPATSILLLSPLLDPPVTGLSSDRTAVAVATNPVVGFQAPF